MLTTVATTSSTFYTYTAVEGETDGEGNQIYYKSSTKVTYPTSSFSYSPAYDSSGKIMMRDGTDPYYVKNEGTDVSGFEPAIFDMRDNSKSISLPAKMMMAINEMVEVKRGGKTTLLQVVPIRFDEYSRLMSKPYKRPLKYQAWRLINNDVTNKADIIVGPTDVLSQYTLRYIRRPNPIIVSDLDGLTIEGIGTTSECELDPILHEEILQRAVELAKVAWTTTGQENLQSMMQAGIRSE